MKIENPLISLINVSKNYGKKIAVNNISLDIPKSCFALLGPNGAGKTTTILMILGLIRPSTGIIRIKGNEVSTNFKHVRKNIGLLPENVGFYPSLSGRTQVELFCRLRYKGGIATYNNIERNAIKLLKWCGLSEEYWDKKVKTYSKGMCQRLGLAQVFAGDPEIIFLDEPFSGIDPLGRDNLIAKIKQKVKEGVSVIISSHIIQEVEQLANYIAIIDEGVVKVADRVDKLAQNFNINEFQITSISKRSQDSLTKCYEDLMSRKEIFLLTTSLLSDKIIVKTQEVHSLFKFLEQYKDLELKPIDGSLIKIYKRLIKNEGGYDN